MIKINQQPLNKLRVVHRNENSQQLRSMNKSVFASISKRIGTRKIAFPIKGGLAFYHVDEIFYCKAEGNYTKVFLLGGQSLLLSKTIKSIEKYLNHDAFIRCHQSYIINKHHVRQFTGDGGLVLHQVTDCIPVARRKRKSVLAELTALIQTAIT